MNSSHASSVTQEPRRTLDATVVRQLALVALAAAVLFIPFLGALPLFDWDEANFAEASREMMATHNYLRVQINFQPFWEKPPLFFWLQCASMKVLGVNEFAARLPNALCGVITLMLVFWVGRRVSGPRFGLFWVLAFAGSFLPHLFFKSGVIDPVFNLLIFSGVLCVVAATAPGRGSALRLYALGGVCIGLAVLAKGPVALLLTLLCVGTFCVVRRSVRAVSVRGVIVLGVVAVCVSLLFYGTETLLHGTWYLREFVKYHLALLSKSEAGHGRPFYFHAAVLLFGCFPASLLALRGIAARPSRSETPEAHLAAWMWILFWVVLVVFSIVRTKTVLYSSLTYFPLTFFAARYMHEVSERRRDAGVVWTVCTAAIGLTVAAGLALLPVVLAHPQVAAMVVKNGFALQCLKRPVAWTGLECLVGIGYALVIATGLWLVVARRGTAGFATLFASTAVCLQIALASMGPNLALIAQGGPLSLYRQCADQSAYVRPLFKSYAYLFYAQTSPSAPPESRDKGWLLNGPIDKPALFVARTDQTRKIRAQFPRLRETNEEYGYVYYRRDVGDSAAAP